MSSPGDSKSFTAYPALKRWAFLFCARGAGLRATQTIAALLHDFVNSVLTQTLKSCYRTGLIRTPSEAAFLHGSFWMVMPV
jgi:hypothetical protein